VVGFGFVNAGAASEGTGTLTPGPSPGGRGEFELGALGGEADFGETQEDEAEDGPEYSWALRPELARN
jgi:hypothetical protein